MTPSRKDLIGLLVEARSRTLDLVADLPDEEMIGPRLRIVNPPLWEIGHVAWFQEKWALRHFRKFGSSRNDADALYDSAAVAHDTRWNLPLPTRRATLSYMAQVLERVVESLGPDPLGEQEAYFHLLPLFHEDMHAEALAYTRQTFAYPKPRFAAATGAPVLRGGGPLGGDVEVPGGRFMVGSTPRLPFVFDNEKWAHPVEIPTFHIARSPVTNAEYREFVEAGGYDSERWWTPEGWAWLRDSGARHPVYWNRESSGRWHRRTFDTFVPVEDHVPVLHVNWYEAVAYCRWAGRRLPTEAEWERAAGYDPLLDSAGPEAGLVLGNRRLFPWGDDPVTENRANLDWQAMGCLEVGALPEGESACGCRQMIGNVWEWTADDFLPYPGFVADPYAEYSQPWFGNHKVLRGGCWATRSRLIRNTWRNFYTPDRRDVWAGFRTCATNS